MERGERLPDLLDALAGLRDHEPLAYAVRQMGRSGKLSGKAVEATLGRLLRQIPDTGVQRLLGGLERVILPDGERAVMVRGVTLAMRHLGLPRLAAFCLMDRWLKNEDPAARQTLGEEAMRGVLGAISRAGNGEDSALRSLEDEVILRVPGPLMIRLGEAAKDAGARAEEAWRRRRQRFAEAVLEVLESLPKSLSQANAEQLLSRRVYTEAGHFLVELLQNAEDAGATRWEVHLGAEEVRVWHNGQDFDARDVVGVLSIGQTTKARGKIGFFGVGFKSVYEICERPQIYSDVFCFEIADISIPRRLSRRPKDSRREGTLLCLPLRDPADAMRSPEALWERARAVPSETLLTLDCLQAMEIREGQRRHLAWKEPGQAPFYQRILETDGKGDVPLRTREYLTIGRNRRFEGSPREASRTSETRVLVALRLDESGSLVPLPEGAATVYSHLPTAERPGFRFLLHAHFDLPIDRERLDLTSPWNRWAIAEGGLALGEAAALVAGEVAAQPPSAKGTARLTALLDILPLSRELSHPAWRAVTEELKGAVAKVPLMPAARGGGLMPREAAVLEDRRLAPFLAGVPLDAQGRQALAALDPRRAELCLELGAASVGPEELLALLEGHLAGLPSGTWPPEPWLAAALLPVLLSVSEARSVPEKSPQRKLELRLAALPILPDVEGRLWRPSEIARADPSLRQLYGTARPLVAPAWEATGSAALITLLERLEVRPLGAEDLVADLALPHRREALLSHAGLDEILAFLAEQPDRVLLGLGELPLFPDQEGLPRPLRKASGGPGLGGTGTGASETSGSEIDDTEIHGTEIHGTEIHGTEIHGTEIHGTEIHGTEIHGAEIYGAEIHGAEIHGSETGGPEPLWRLPEGRLGTWMLEMEGERPPLLRCSVEEAHGPLLERLGCKRRSPEDLLDALAEGVIRPQARDVINLHLALDSMRAELTPRVGARIADAEIFPTMAGDLRSLSGPKGAILPGQPDIVVLAPTAPWVVPEVAHLAYLPQLGVVGAGPQDVVNALSEQGSCREGPTHKGPTHEEATHEEATRNGPSRHGRSCLEGWLDPGDPETLRRAYSYLHRHGSALDRASRALLATAPIWFDEGGIPRPLCGLRQPPAEPSLWALYAVWKELPLIETKADGSIDAASLVHALGLSDSLRPSNFQGLVQELVSARPEALETLLASESPLGPLLQDALAAAALYLPRAVLVPLSKAPIFRSNDGKLRPLGEWTRPPFDPERCGPAMGPIAAALGHGTRPLLNLDEERTLLPLLRALDATPATLVNLLEAVETDAALRTPGASAAVRQALLALVEEVPRALGFTPSEGGGHPRLEALPMWPTTDGGLRPASALVRPSALALALGPHWERAFDSEATSLLDEAKAPEAASLEGVVRFRSPASLLIDRLKREARPGEPLSNQPAFLQREGAFAPILSVLREALGTDALFALPVMVDARGCLVAAKLFRASAHEIALAQDLPLEKDLAHPAWAEEAWSVVRELAPPLPARRLVLALAQNNKTERPVGEHPILCHPEARDRLHEWILLRKEEIARDDQALGPLGQACLFPTQGGTLTSPRRLLFDPDLPEIFAAERPADSIPEPLVTWLRQVFQLEDRQLDRLVEHLLTAHEEAAAAKDAARSTELLEILARLLGIHEEGPLPSLPRRLKLHRRLRVASAEGAFLRPRRLLAPDPDHFALMEIFHTEPPLRASGLYRSLGVRRLLTALGAADDLRPEMLHELLETGKGLRPGHESGLALARYLALRAAGEPGLAKALRLPQRRFLPDGSGSLRKPAELFWPTAETRAVIGDRPDAYPHPELFLTVPRSLVDSLPFRALDEAPLDLVVVSLTRAASRGEAPEAQLGWLETGLSTRRIDPARVRAALQEVPCLPDSQGWLRRPRDLFRVEVASLFGTRRGYFLAGRNLRRLSDALGISQQPGRRDLQRFLSEVAEDAERQSPQTLATEEPELIRCLPRCLARWVELGDPLPSPVLLAALDLHRPGEDRPILALSSDPRLVLPEPDELFMAARRTGVPLLVPVLRDHAPLLTEALGKAGVPTLSRHFHPARLPRRPAGEVTGEYPKETGRLLRALSNLERKQRDLARAHPQVPHAMWRPVKLPSEVRVLAQILRQGELAGVPVEVESAVVVEGETLWVTPSGLTDLDRVAETLTRECLTGGVADPLVVADVAGILEAAWPVEAQPALPWTPSQAVDSIQPAPLSTKEASEAPEGRAAAQSARPEGEDLSPQQPRPDDSPPKQPGRAPKELPHGRAHEDPASERPGHGRETTPRDQEAQASAEGEGKSLLTRFRRWLRGDETTRPASNEEQQGAEPSSLPGGRRGQTGGTGPRGHRVEEDDPSAPPPSHSRFFSPRDAVRSQIGSGRAWLRDRDRPPAYGFAFAPSRLPLPYLYAPQLVADRFDGKTQSWSSTGLPERFSAPLERGEGSLVLKGRLPKGERLLPMPLYGRLESVEGPTRILSALAGRILVTAPEPCDITMRVSLGGAPRFEYTGSSESPLDLGCVPSHLLCQTVPDAELPEPVLAFADVLATSGEPSLRRALEVRSFVQRNYRYDPSYLEDPDLAQWLEGLTRGRASAHLALLHAGRDARHLGAGVCYELNVLCCELLRRVNVPAAISTGWTFDRGRLDEPDHLWAMALVPSDLGPRWLPLDASTTRDGRPLHAMDRPAGPWRARLPRGTGRMPKAPAWAAAPQGPSVDTSLPLPDLLRVARHVARLTGTTSLDESLLRQRCRELLDDPARARAFLDLLKGP